VLHVDDGTSAPHPRVPPNVTLTREVRPGSLEDAVKQAIAERDPQLLVMVSHGHDELWDVLWSSHTERVLHTSRRPLLWVPPGFAARLRA
jgi:nucleotide-binding universal stress UspA family protein